MAGLRRFLVRLLTSLRLNRAEDDLARDARSFRWIDDARRDGSYAFRTLRRSPAFTAVAVTTLALGIGATTAIFSIFDAVLLRPLAVDRPDELRVVRQVAKMMGGRVAKESNNVPYSWFLELRPRPEVFTEVIAFAEGLQAMLTVNGHDRRAIGGVIFVSDNYFDVLGVRPAVGRTFTTGSSGAAERAVVVSDSFWRREFDGSPAAIGSQILVNGAGFTIVGITPAAFTGLELGQVPDLYLPVETMSAAQPAAIGLANRAGWSVQVIGRLQPGITDTAAGERLTATRDFMKTPDGASSRALNLLPLETGLSDVRASLARPLSLLLGMGSLLLLIACANVATLLGARAASRRSEIVIRTAVGAGRSRLVRQLLTESIMLAALAGSIGVLAGAWATRALLGLLPQDANPLQLEVAMDRRVLGFAIAISLLTAVVAGVVPALRAVGFDLASALRDRSRGGTGAAHGRPFAVAQVALSMILVVASAMFARTVYNLTTVDLGFDPDHLLQVFVAPGDRQYQGPALEKYYRTAFERLRAIPGIRSVTSAQMQLLDRGRTTGTVDVPGWEARSEEEREIQMFQVGPGYFETTGMRLAAGRDFSDQDVFGTARVAAINDVAARRFFGGNDPIGQTIRSGGTYQIIGVVRSAKYNSLRDEEPPAMFVPYTTVRTRPRMTFIVRSAGDDQAVSRLASAALRAEDSLIPLDVAPVSTLVGRNMAQERLLATLSVLFAIAALVLLSIGLYGIMTFWVTERTPEIGIHLALGARLSQVRWVVIRQPLWLAALGIGIGLPAALAASRVVDGLMFGVEPRDPLAIGAAVAVILSVTVAACVAPARRAARIDPMTALRCE